MKFTHALVTRPHPQGVELAARLRPWVAPIDMPAFRFAARGEGVAPDDAWRRARRRLLLFTSPRAVEFGLAALAPEMLDGATSASVGPATTRALEQAGLAPVQAPGPDFDSEALLRTLDHELASDGEDPGSGAAVIFAAPGGREALQRGLAARGWHVRFAPVYERRLIAPEPSAVAELERAGHVASFWTSGVAIAHLLDTLSDTAADRIRAGIAIVISERLAELAREHGLGDVVVAKGPANDDLVRQFAALAGVPVADS